MYKVGRNDPCPCGSGKKFKKCHEPLMGPKKFTAQVISQEQTGEPRNLTSLFQRNVKPPQILAHEPPPEEKTYDI